VAARFFFRGEIMTDTTAQIASEASPAPAPVKKEAVYRLTGPRMKEASYARTVYHVTPEAGTPFEALLRAEYWAHVAIKLRPMDRVEVLAEDGGYFAELLVISTSRLAATVAVLSHVVLTSADQAPATDEGRYDTKWGGPVAKWRVVRRVDNVVVRDGFANKDEARRFIDDLAQAKAA
jgi:hypothetical protein